MIAMNRAPGALKGHFAFQSIKGYGRIIPGESAPTVAPRQHSGASPEQIWKEIVLEAKSHETTDNLPPIIATDISPEAVENAHTNAIAAGVAPYITFKACDFAETPIPEAKVCIFFNPEYGIRLGDPKELAPVYERIGTFLHEKCPGWMGASSARRPDSKGTCRRPSTPSTWRPSWDPSASCSTPSGGIRRGRSSPDTPRARTPRPGRST